MEELEKVITEAWRHADLELVWFADKMKYVAQAVQEYLEKEYGKKIRRDKIDCRKEPICNCETWKQYCPLHGARNINE